MTMDTSIWKHYRFPLKPAAGCPVAVVSPFPSLHSKRCFALEVSESSALGSPRWRSSGLAKCGCSIETPVETGWRSSLTKPPPPTSEQRFDFHFEKRIQQHQPILVKGKSHKNNTLEMSSRNISVDLVCCNHSITIEIQQLEIWILSAPPLEPRTSNPQWFLGISSSFFSASSSSHIIPSSSCWQKITMISINYSHI